MTIWAICLIILYYKGRKYKLIYSIEIRVSVLFGINKKLILDNFSMV